MNSRDAAAKIERLILSAATLELQLHSLRVPSVNQADQKPTLFIVRGHHALGLDLVADARRALLRLATRNVGERYAIQKWDFDGIETTLSNAARRLVTVAEAIKESN